MKKVEDRSVAVKFIADSGVSMDVSIINEQKGIMWEEAKRNARKIQGKQSYKCMCKILVSIFIKMKINYKFEQIIK